MQYRQLVLHELGHLYAAIYATVFAQFAPFGERLFADCESQRDSNEIEERIAWPQCQQFTVSKFAKL